ncbi:hypothetical protein KAR91_31890 [Candidatus Pacearchaeota archaeon]|nr:hypothetical protein [Candidatus Pacearchaeota archaeon]
MGLITRVLSFVRVVRNGIYFSDVKMNPDGGSNITGEHFADAGDDSFPLPTDYAVTTTIQRSGGEVPVGYADPINEPKAEAGEKRIYGRDASSGAQVNEVWLKADGAVLISNINGSFELKADGSMIGQNSAGSFELEAGGDFVINGATITALGDVVTALGRSLDTHIHSGVTTGPSNTGPPV